jgi:NAD(P)-dependent dehydrogenase (short-subunit alcohol dehydrogenase family)
MATRQVVLITGASTGSGRALALEFISRLLALALLVRVILKGPEQGKRVIRFPFCSCTHNVSDARVASQPV